MNAIEIKDLCKTYPGYTLDHIDLTLPCGCIMGLVGENGAGKSTTMKLILDMIKRDSGSIKLFGKENTENIQLAKEDIGVVLDEVGFPGAFTALIVGKIMKNTFSTWDDNLFADYLRQMSVPDNKPFSSFSRGMKMKLGIAVALSHKPKLLILDEATSGLDPVVRDEILDIFNEFTRDETHAVLISSHIVTDLEKICDYIAFLHKGKMLLCEEKDVLREEYGLIHCTNEQLSEIPEEAVIGRKETPYGTEAIVRREMVPAGTETGNVDIEQLFIFMVKERKTR